MDELEFDGITKSFPGVRALDAVTFRMAGGSVHALIGENGAGKSTLLKILSGAYLPDSGTVRLNGRARSFRTTAEALAEGVAVIYQEPHLVPEMTVEENLFLGHFPARRGILDRKSLRNKAVRQLAALGTDIAPAAKLKSLSAAGRQMVEIAKAMTREARVIAFDEPTSSLSERETARLFAVIRGLKEKGAVILYVTHRMREVFEVCDAATVLRDGRRVETFPALKTVAPDTLINRMVGRDIKDIYRYSPRTPGGKVLEVAGLSGSGLAAPVSFSVARGEIAGLFGLVGAGRSELLRLLYGDLPMQAGEIRVLGRKETIAGPPDAIRAGIVLCPEDRKKDGVFPLLSVEENINISARRRHAFLGTILDRAWERANARNHADKLAIKTPSLGRFLMNLSGGNQQKVILARWLSETVKVMLLDEPTRGIDVGAKSEIYSIIRELARSGVGILVATSELPEVIGISDRIMVMREGRISGTVPRAEASEEALLRLALPGGEADA